MRLRPISLPMRISGLNERRHVIFGSHLPDSGKNASRFLFYWKPDDLDEYVWQRGICVDVGSALYVFSHFLFCNKNGIISSSRFSDWKLNDDMTKGISQTYFPPDLIGNTEDMTGLTSSSNVSSSITHFPA